MSRATPATPLPWVQQNAAVYAPSASDRGPVIECRIRTGTHVPADANARNLAYALHACNAYPQLIEALRYCIERGHSPDVDNGCVQAVALLHSLGEAV